MVLSIAFSCASCVAKRDSFVRVSSSWLVVCPGKDMLEDKMGAKEDDSCLRSWAVGSFGQLPPGWSGSYIEGVCRTHEAPRSSQSIQDISLTHTGLEGSLPNLRGSSSGLCRRSAPRIGDLDEGL